MRPVLLTTCLSTVVACTGKVTHIPDDQETGTPPTGDTADSGDSGGPPIEPDPDPYTTWLDPVALAGGAFDMGCTRPSEWPCSDDERPARTVTVPALQVLRTEVPRGMVRSLTGTAARPPGCTQDDCAATGLSWHDAIAFCNLLSQAEGLRPAYTVSGTDVTWDTTSDGWRLPTEAEWEYAARGNRDLLYAGSSDLEQVAWTEDDSGGRPHVGGEKAANDFDLSDMSGNVWEWVWDRYGAYDPAALDQPTGPTSGDARVLRGGGWSDPGERARVSARRGELPATSTDDIGLRVVRGAQVSGGAPLPPRGRTAAE